MESELFFKSIRKFGRRHGKAIDAKAFADMVRELAKLAYQRGKSLDGVIEGAQECARVWAAFDKF